VGEYFEIAPPPRLSTYVECFWWLRSSEGDMDHRVLPDACTDLIFSTLNGRVRGSAVGFMTRAIVSPLAPREEIFGVRFRPAMSHGILRIPVSMLTDVIVDLESLWGKQARALEQRLADARSHQERIGCIESVLEPGGPPTPVQRAALWVVENRGDASAAELARHAGLSARQFRRLCIEQTGVGPKMLCRIVRFRNAANDVLHRAANWADFALDHGYYDQAHFINEFREFCGVTPAEYATVFSNTRPGAML
jgi:AraC-like DNA-binding protein